MREFFEWFSTQNSNLDSWLILGKGPSFSKLGDYDTTKHKKLALNHTAREVPVDISHIIDLDVIDQSGTEIINNSQALVMPWIPHVHNTPGDKSLEELLPEHPALQKAEQEGKLVWYALASGGHRNPPTEHTVNASYFSSEAAVSLLAQAGTKRIFTLGVDGGTQYSETFSDLNDITRLANRQPSFDFQFISIAKSVRQYNLEFRPLWVDSPVRVYVGATKDQELAVQVLNYSIQYYASLNVEVVPLYSSTIDTPEPKDPSNRPRTPFSFQRFLIPEINHFKGKAIYMDSDMQVFRDILQLWSIPMNNCDVLAVGESLNDRKPQFSVMLMDCEKLNWSIEKIVESLNSGEFTYQQLLGDLCVAERIGSSIPKTWNSLEYYHPDSTCLLHYTEMPTQPWLSRGHPYEHLWFGALYSALDENFIDQEVIERSLENGYIRPSAKFQIENRLLSSALLPHSIQKMDKEYRAPYGFRPKHAKPGWAERLPAMLPGNQRKMENKLRRALRKEAGIRI